MPDNHFKIVCEGNTDLEALKVLIPRIGISHNKKYKASPLFPAKNTTDAGWSNLKIWCQKQASTLNGTLNQQKHMAAQLLGAKPDQKIKNRKIDQITAATLIGAGGSPSKILMQMDADIVHDLLTDIGVCRSQHIFPMLPAQRAQYCELALDSWLGPHASKKGTLIHYCITTMALENWILTLHDEQTIGIPAGMDYDNILSPDNVLVSLKYASKNGILKKDPPKYKVYGSNIANNLPLSLNRSSSFAKLNTTLLNA